MNKINEGMLEEQALSLFKELGYSYEKGADISEGGANPARVSYKQVLLLGQLRLALARLNPHLPDTAICDAVGVLKTLNGPALLSVNQEAYKLIKEGILVQYRFGDALRSDRVKVIDFDCANNNDWLVVNQLKVRGANRTRIPDIVVYLNGLPLSVIELKNPADENVDVWNAFQQLETYKKDIPDLFYFNVLQGLSDGVETRIGAIASSKERFLKWRTIDGIQLDPPTNLGSLETMIRGVFEKELFLDYVKNFVLFENDGSRILKKIAGYHQFHAVRKAHSQILSASAAGGNRQGGVVWHTQGAGKSIEMVCLAGKVMTDPRMKNPTIVVVTDRNDLDGQLYGVFSSAHDMLRETPVQIKSRPDLRKALTDKNSGGVLFTTIQKFFPGEDEDVFPKLSDRENVVVIVDEAHRTQYGFKVELSEDGMKYGYAQHLRDALPNATYIAFTGTPVESVDKHTRRVFGEYVDVYDMKQAVEDGATVPVYYEPRLIKLHLDTVKEYQIDAQAEEVVEDDDVDVKAETKAKWASLEKIAGASARVDCVVEDLLTHFNARSEVIEGKGLIVGMSRELCVRLYDEIVKRNPDWHSDDPNKGVIKVVMTGTASDDEKLQKHCHSSEVKKLLEKRFKDPTDPLKLVIVRDMWLTGFDAPCLHTLYIDKPMQGPNLMQAIARVNRVFKDKPGGVVVDYIGIGKSLQSAVSQYSFNGREHSPIGALNGALGVMHDRLSEARALLAGSNYEQFTVKPLETMLSVVNHVLALPDGKKDFTTCVLYLTKAYALCNTLPDAKKCREEVAFFQAVRSSLVKHGAADAKFSDEAKEQALKELVSEAVVTHDGVVDLFAAAGVAKPNLALLSDEFLGKVSGLAYKNLAVELLERLLREELKNRLSVSYVNDRKFSTLLNDTLKRYHQRATDTQDIIDQLLQLAHEFNQEKSKALQLGLTYDEKAIYDALSASGKAVLDLGEEVLKDIAKKLTSDLRSEISVDFGLRANLQAKLRTKIKTVLLRNKFPPEALAEAVSNALNQVEALSDEWLSAK